MSSSFLIYPCMRETWKTATILGGGVSFTECCYGESSWNAKMMGEMEIFISLLIKDEFVNKIESL